MNTVPTTDARSQLIEEGHRRYLEFTKLTFGLATGSLTLLIAFEDQLPPSTGGSSWMLPWSWIVLGVSILSGLLLQLYLVCSPVLRWSNRRAEPARLKDGREVLITVVPGKVAITETCLFAVHMLALVSGIGLALWYKLAVVLVAKPGP